jgi:uncharacterized protein (UPF0262 family)
MDSEREKAMLLDALLATIAATTPETEREDTLRIFDIIERQVRLEAEEEGQL